MMQLHQTQNQLELKSKTSCFLYWQRRTKCKTSHLFEDGLAPNAEVAFSIDGTAPNANPTVFSVGEPKSKPAFFFDEVAGNSKPANPSPVDSAPNPKPAAFSIAETSPNPNPVAFSGDATAPNGRTVASSVDGTTPNAKSPLYLKMEQH